MDADKKRVFEERMQGLVNKYCQQLPGKYQEIEDSWKNYQSDSTSPDLIELFYRLIHTLKGTASTFGFTKQSDICYQIQRVLLDIKEKHEILSPSKVSSIQKYLDELKNNINAPPEDIIKNN